GETLALYHVADNVQFVIQKEQLGTGDAVKAVIPFFTDADPDATNIVLNGDAPLLTSDTINGIYRNFIENKYKLQITCISSDCPSGNGRIVTDEAGAFCRIVEEKDCTDAQRAITLVNCGIYVATVKTLVTYIPLIKNDNAQQEYYLT